LLRARAAEILRRAHTSDPDCSHAAIAWIDRLDEVIQEATKQELDAAPRHVLRQERSRPLLDRPHVGAADLAGELRRKAASTRPALILRCIKNGLGRTFTIEQM
jgi:hypothetical protein